MRKPPQAAMGIAGSTGCGSASDLDRADAAVDGLVGLLRGDGPALAVFAGCDPVVARPQGKFARFGDAAAEP